MTTARTSLATRLAQTALPRLTEPEIRSLAEDPSWKVRHALALREDCPTEIRSAIVAAQLDEWGYASVEGGYWHNWDKGAPRTGPVQAWVRDMILRPSLRPAHRKQLLCQCELSWGQWDRMKAKVLALVSVDAATLEEVVGAFPGCEDVLEAVSGLDRQLVRLFTTLPDARSLTVRKLLEVIRSVQESPNRAAGLRLEEVFSGPAVTPGAGWKRWTSLTCAEMSSLSSKASELSEDGWEAFAGFLGSGEMVPHDAIEAAALVTPPRPPTSNGLTSVEFAVVEAWQRWQAEMTPLRVAFDNAVKASALGVLHIATLLGISPGAAASYFMPSPGPMRLPSGGSSSTSASATAGSAA